MKIDDIADGDVVRARFGRYTATKPEPDWSEWQYAALFVGRDKKGKVCWLTPRDTSWAEYDPRKDFYPADSTLPCAAGFECEGYYMEIEGLE